MLYDTQTKNKNEANVAQTIEPDTSQENGLNERCDSKTEHTKRLQCRQKRQPHHVTYTPPMVSRSITITSSEFKPKFNVIYDCTKLPKKWVILGICVDVVRSIEFATIAIHWFVPPQNNQFRFESYTRNSIPIWLIVSIWFGYTIYPV